MTLMLCLEVNGGESVNSALVPLDRPYVESLLRRIDLAAKLKEEDSQFYIVEYFDSTPTWYSDYFAHEGMDDFELDRVTPAGAAELIQLMHDTKPYQGTTGHTLKIDENYVYWECANDYNDQIYETDTVGRDELEELLKELP